MSRGSPPFTPRQLLEAGRRAESEGRLDLAQQFYGHLSEQYGHTSEASEGRQGLARIGAGAPHPQVWQMNGAAPPANGKLPAGRMRRAGNTSHGGDYRAEYRVGRALAALLSGIGWLTVAAASLALATAVATELTQAAALQGLRLGFGAVPQAMGALLGGAVALLLGQAARALFDQASAARELAAIERARAGSEHF